MVAPRLPPAPGLVAFFAQALQTFQRAGTPFAVLCSLPARGDPTTPVPPPPPPPRRPASLLVLDSSFNPPTLAHQRMALSALADATATAAATATVPAPAPAAVPRVLLLLAINNADKAPQPAAFPQRLAMMYVFALDLVAAAAAARATRGHDDGGGGSSSDGDDDGNGLAVDIAVTTEPYFHSKSAAVASCAFYGGQEAPSDDNDNTPPPPPMGQVYLTGYDTLIRVFNAKYYPDDSMRTALDPFFAHSRLRVTTRTHADWGTAADQAAYLDGLRNGALEARGGRAGWADKVDMVHAPLEDGQEAISSTKVREAVANQDWERLRTLVSDGVAEWVRQAGLYTEGTGP